MREILFRGKRIDNGEWEYGGCVFTENKVCLIYNQTHSIDLQGFTVEENSVGQYAGLTDKNGKKIFEGDIIKATDSVPEYSLMVIRAEGYGYFVDYYFGGEKYDTEQIHDADWFLSDEVIGNIHENPELLEVTK